MVVGGDRRMTRSGPPSTFESQPRRHYKPSRIVYLKLNRQPIHPHYPFPSHKRRILTYNFGRINNSVLCFPGNTPASIDGSVSGIQAHTPTRITSGSSVQNSGRCSRKQCTSQSIKLSQRSYKSAINSSNRTLSQAPRQP